MGRFETTCIDCPAFSSCKPIQRISILFTVHRLSFVCCDCKGPQGELPHTCGPHKHAGQSLHCTICPTCILHNHCQCQLTCHVIVGGAKENLWLGNECLHTMTMTVTSNPAYCLPPSRPWDTFVTRPKEARATRPKRAHSFTVILARLTWRSPKSATSCLLQRSRSKKSAICFCFFGAGRSLLISVSAGVSLTRMMLHHQGIAQYLEEETCKSRFVTITTPSGQHIPT